MNCNYCVVEKSKLLIIFLFFLIPIKAVSQDILYFDLNDVKLNESPFYRAMKLNEAWLLSLQPDRLLSGFRQEAGLTPKAPKYGGWESLGVAGHSFGHYLSATAMLYAATGNQEFLHRINYCMNELEECQNTLSTGLIAGFPRAKELFEEVSSGNIRTQGFDLNGGWVPLYNMHKLVAGLVDVYHYTNSKQSYTILIKLSDYFVTLFSKLSDEQIQKILVSEHGGINEAFANVYGLTKNIKYLDLAVRLNHKAVLDPLARGKDELSGKHANTQIPKVIGCVKVFSYTNDKRLYRIADFFWNTVIQNHSYVIGGNSEAEHFGAAGRTHDRITDKTCENCNTYNMLKLTKYLYQLAPSPEKIDYYERALYNQIVGSQHPENGMVCYMSPLATGSRKTYSTPFDSFWCCVGTGFENHSRYGEFIYHTDKAGNLYVNLFIPSTLYWKERNLQLEQVTGFPDSDTIKYILSGKINQKFSINMRIPGWLKGDFKLLINDKEHLITSKDIQQGYVHINRNWKNKDVITYIIPQSFHSEAALGDESLRAYLYGPIVLSGKLSGKDTSTVVVVSDDFEKVSLVKQQNSNGEISLILQNSIPEKTEMYPYYKSADNPLMVYIPHFTPDEWAKNKDSFLAKKDVEKWITEATISHFRPGEMQPERDHELTGINMAEPGVIQGRPFRKAVDGGEFSFMMEVSPDKPVDLMCSFWGELGDIYKFEVLVDGESVATVIIHWWGNSFSDKTYKIPEHLTKGKSRIRVTLKALDKHSVAGPLFDCRTIFRNK